MPYLCDAMVKQYSWQIMFTVGQGMGTLRPLMLVSPIIAETIAGWGWSKQDLQRHLFDHARITARQFERIEARHARSRFSDLHARIRRDQALARGGHSQMKPMPLVIHTMGPQGQGSRDIPAELVQQERVFVGPLREQTFGQPGQEDHSELTRSRFIH